jgi:hypothetical protein
MLFDLFKSIRAMSLSQIYNLNTWQRRDFGNPSPQFIKHLILRKWGGEGTWIESGTYLGSTTDFLAHFARRVVTIEPQQDYAEMALLKFRFKQNVTVLFGSSEDLMCNLLTSLDVESRRDVSFWLDGHFSGIGTFQGQRDTPIASELSAISKNILNFGSLTVLVDDIRLFYQNDGAHEDYPSLQFLVEWAIKHNLFWTIEHDIFIASNRLNG